MRKKTFVGDGVAENIAFDVVENTVQIKNGDDNEAPLDRFEDALDVVEETGFSIVVGNIKVSDDERTDDDGIVVEVADGHGRRRTTVERVRRYIEEARSLVPSIGDELAAALKESGLSEDYFEVVETVDGGDPRHTHFIVLKENGHVADGDILDALEGWEVNWVSTVGETGPRIYDDVEERHVGRPDIAVRKRE